jgi:hypothetical protein
MSTAPRSYGKGASVEGSELSLPGPLFVELWWMAWGAVVWHSRCPGNGGKLTSRWAQISQLWADSGPHLRALPETPYQADIARWALLVVSGCRPPSRPQTAMQRC